MNKNIVVSENEIIEMAKRVGHEITAKLKGSNKIPVIVGVMKGALNFMMDVIKYIECPIYTDFIQVSSYEGTSSSGQVMLVKDLSFNLEGRDVVIVEDIVDSGASMQYLLEHLKSHNPRNVYVCTMFDKVNARKVPVQIDFVGKTLDKNDFLIGYGLDYCQLERNIPYVYSASKEDVEGLDKILQTDKNN